MIIKELEIDGIFEIQIEKKLDNRGFFSRIYCENEFKNIGLQTKWVQMNLSFTEKLGTIRGMHFQKNPFGEEKIIRCINGSIFDVFVDLRTWSASYGKWISIELDNNRKNAIYLPKGIAHGFQTLTDNVEVIYMHSEFYNKDAESGINYNDPTLKIKWPLEVADISIRDSSLPYFLIK